MPAKIIIGIKKHKYNNNLTLSLVGEEQDDVQAGKELFYLYQTCTQGDTYTLGVVMAFVHTICAHILKCHHEDDDVLYMYYAGQVEICHANLNSRNRLLSKRAITPVLIFKFVLLITLHLNS